MILRFNTKSKKIAKGNEGSEILGGGVVFTGQLQIRMTAYPGLATTPERNSSRC